MTELLDKTKAKLMAYGVTACFFSIHVFMFFFFRYHNVAPMVVFNIFNLLFYVAMLLLIKKEMFRVFAVGVYLEVVAHMCAATYFTGLGAGFQITLIGMNILLFYAEYVGRAIKVPYIEVTPLAISGMIAYLVLLYIDFIRPAPYPLPEKSMFILQVFWGFVVFSIMIFFLNLFVNLTTRTEEMLSQEVLHDQLTGLPNRYFVKDYLSNLVDKESLKNYWCAMVDIDNFKMINDTYGHNCGDCVLKELASILKSSQINMTVCRWGGEEFLLIGKIENPHPYRIAQLNLLRENVMEHLFEFEENVLQITITIGTADYTEGATIHAWIGEADEKLYEGKNSGKNKVVA